MRISKFWIFLLLVLVVLAVAPQDLSKKDTLSFNKIEMPFSSKSPEQIDEETYKAIYDAIFRLRQYKPCHYAVI